MKSGRRSRPKRACARARARTTTCVALRIARSASLRTPSSLAPGQECSGESKSGISFVTRTHEGKSRKRGARRTRDRANLPNFTPKYAYLVLVTIFHAHHCRPSSLRRYRRLLSRARRSFLTARRTEDSGRLQLIRKITQPLPSRLERSRMFSGAPLGPIDTRARACFLSFFLVDREEWRVNPIAGLSEIIPVRTCGEYNLTYYGRLGLAPRSPRDRPCAVRRTRVASRTEFRRKTKLSARRPRPNAIWTDRQDGTQRAVLAPPANRQCRLLPGRFTPRNARSLFYSFKIDLR